MATKKQHEIADKVLKLLKTPGDWRVENYPSGDTYTLIHKHKYIKLWMCNDFWFFRMDNPFEIRFPFWKKIKLWKIAKPLFDKLSKVKKVDTEALMLKHLNKK